MNETTLSLNLEMLDHLIISKCQFWFKQKTENSFFSVYYPLGGKQWIFSILFL